jgi:hypothetical protein
MSDDIGVVRDLAGKMVEDINGAIDRVVAISPEEKPILIAAASTAVYRLAFMMNGDEPPDRDGLIMAALGAAHFAIDPATAHDETEQDFIALIAGDRVQTEGDEDT